MRRRYRAAQGLSRPLGVDHVVARERSCVLPAGQLDLEDHVVLHLEGKLRTCKVELEHPAEPLVVQRGDGIAVGGEALAPVGERLRIMQPQDLNVGAAQAGPFERREHLGQRGRIPAGENVFRQPRAGDVRTIEAADRVQQGNPVRLQAPLHRGKETRIIRHADMLEHADRHDAVEFAGHRPVVHQFETDAIGEPLRLGAAACLRELFLGKGDPGHPRAIVARQGQRHAAPAAADVENFQVRPVEQQLGGDMPLLRRLCLVDRLVAARKIAAGILPVTIEEQRVEPAVQIIVMRDVALRAAGIVELRQRAEHPPERVAQP
ncbi:hypothetical protein APM_1296 [Acidiphilium sp. PM]|nr:hypothetical protein APM_1296 [Acidiphilium sp. PM]